MQLADRSLINATPPIDRASPMFSEPNQSVYLNLKLSLSLNLRRQLFLAVCDDLALRNRLAAQLYAELAYPPQSSTPSNCPSKPTSGHSDRYSSVAKDGIRTDTLAIKQTLPLAYPRLVSLNLNLHHPNPMVQIKQWLEQYPPPRGFCQQSQCPGFQILGIERLTRQSALVQREFLNSLQQIEQYLCSLESALLLWVPRPWLRAIQQSAPRFGTGTPPYLSLKVTQRLFLTRRFLIVLLTVLLLNPPLMVRNLLNKRFLYRRTIAAQRPLQNLTV